MPFIPGLATLSIRSFYILFKKNDHAENAMDSQILRIL